MQKSKMCTQLQTKLTTASTSKAANELSEEIDTDKK